MNRFTVLYDACVLYPAPLRDLLLRLALTDLYRARWSDAIHEEWIRAVLRNRPDLSRHQLERTRALMGDAARPRRTGDRRSHCRQAQQLEQGPWELADALVELARQQSQKRPVPATARSALDAWRCRSAGSAGARGCIGAGGPGPQR